MLETILISAVISKIIKTKKGDKKNNKPFHDDFLIQCRTMLKIIIGHEKAANILASEIAVFYYIFYRRNKDIKDDISFTSYKENGIILVWYAILGIFLVECCGMHFVFLIWNQTAAWIITGLSLYSCLQLFAHICAIKSRPIQIKDKFLVLRNGLLGGEVQLELNNIETINHSKKFMPYEKQIQLAVLKSFENPNVILQLKNEITVIKAFGIKKTGKIISFKIDEAEKFVNAINLKIL